jgi:ElaB/YqjD/DUF883 family membrane-anchored ribosome-binding protein
MSDPEATRSEPGARAVREESAEPVAETAERGGEAPPPSDPEELRRDIEETRADLGDTVEALSRKADVKGQLIERLEARKAALRARQEELRAKAASVRERRASAGTPEGAGASEGAKATASKVMHTAEERPFPAVGVAFAVGFVLAWLIGRR